jgi:hypothetical protein
MRPSSSHGPSSWKNRKRKTAHAIGLILADFLTLGRRHENHRVIRRA